MKTTATATNSEYGRKTYQVLVQTWDGEIKHREGRTHQTWAQLTAAIQLELFHDKSARRARLLELPTGRIIANYKSVFAD